MASGWSLPSSARRRFSIAPRRRAHFSRRTHRARVFYRNPWRRACLHLTALSCTALNELTPAAIDPLVLEITEKRYRQAIEKAAELRVPKLVLHAGFVPLVYYPEWFVSRSVLLWKRLIADVPEHLTVCLENVMEPDASMLLDIVRQVNDARLRICLDLGHANTSASRETPADWLKACAPYLSHVHLHNNDGIHDLHAPLFEGAMDIAALLKQLNALCPDASVTLELSSCRKSVEWLVRQNLLEE